MRSKRFRLGLVMAGLGFASLHAAADALTGAALVSNEVPVATNTAKYANDNDIRLETRPEKDVWVGSVFSGQRRVNNVPDVAQAQPSKVFYGFRKMGLGASGTTTTPLNRSSEQDAATTATSELALAANKPKRRVRISTSRRYRTVCVRLCDGHYFPVSESTSFHNLKRDEARCQARCGAPAKLYISPVGLDPQSGQTKLVSISGEPYMALKTAYLYRTKRVASCSCVAPPDSERARERHAGYAIKKIDAVTQRLAQIDARRGNQTHVAIKTEWLNQSHHYSINRPRRSERYAAARTSTLRPRRRPAARHQPRH